jgi:hypothetical protein
MEALRLVHSDDAHEVYEEEVWDADDEVEVELADGDIACEEPADESRPSVQVHYEHLNVFLGQYLKVRRGETLVVPAPRTLEPGDLIDVEIAIDRLEAFVLHAQLLQRWPIETSELAEVQFVAGKHTDRMLFPLAARALGPRHATRLLKS